MQKVFEDLYDLILEEMVKIAKTGQYTINFDIVDFINKNFIVKKEEISEIMSMVSERFEKNGFTVDKNDVSLSISWPNL